MFYNILSLRLANVKTIVRATIIQVGLYVIYTRRSKYKHMQRLLI